jgi:hypothetical protein
MTDHSYGETRHPAVFPNDSEFARRNRVHIDSHLRYEFTKLNPKRMPFARGFSDPHRLPPMRHLPLSRQVEHNQREPAKYPSF